MRNTVIKDTILELWRGNVSYIILIVMSIGLIQSIFATYSIKNLNWFQTIDSINIKKYGYMSSLFLFSFIWKGIILSVLGAFTFSKYSFADKLSFLFLPINKSTYLIFRLLGLLLFLAIFFGFWNLVLGFSVLPLKLVAPGEILLFSTLGDIIILFFLAIPLAVGIYFSPITASFLSLFIFFIGSFHLFLTPFVTFQIPIQIEKVLIIFPNFISLVMFFPLKYLNVPYGIFDIYPNVKSLIFYLFQSFIFLIFFLLRQKNIEL